MFGKRGRMNTRLMTLAVGLALAGALLTGRVVQVQIVDNAHYKAEARQEHFGQQEVRAPRGRSWTGTATRWRRRWTRTTCTSTAATGATRR